MTSTCRRTVASRSPRSRINSVKPNIPFKGVRISWLMAARKSVFAWLLISACACAFSAASRVRARVRFCAIHRDEQRDPGGDEQQGEARKDPMPVQERPLRFICVCPAARFAADATREQLRSHIAQHADRGFGAPWIVELLDQGRHLCRRSHLLHGLGTGWISLDQVPEKGSVRQVGAAEEQLKTKVYSTSLADAS